MKKAARRTPRGVSTETPSKTATPPTAKIDWRTAKWNGKAMPSRNAAAGLEPNDSITPSPISASAAPSSQWSTVHHHSPSRERSARENGCAEDGSSSSAMGLGANLARHGHGELVDGGAEGFAAVLEIGELVERSAGWRQQHDGVLAGGARVLEGGAHRRLHHPAPDMRHAAPQRGGERVLRLADQVGLRDAAEEVGQALDAAGLRLAAGDPVDLWIARERLARGVGV